MELFVHQSDGRPRPDAWPSYRTHAPTPGMQRSHIRHIILLPRMLYIETRKIKLEFYVQTRKCGLEAGGVRASLSGAAHVWQPGALMWISVIYFRDVERGARLARRVVVCGGRPHHTPADGGGSLVCGSAGVRKRCREVRNAGRDKIWILLLFCTEASEWSEAFGMHVFRALVFRLGIVVI